MPTKNIENGLTVGEIGARVRRLARDPLTVIENLRHYGKLGFLRVVARSGEGTGKHRLYDPDAIYDAAILVALAGAGLHPGERRWLADVISICRHALRKWKAERRKGHTPPLFVTASFDPQLSGRTEIVVHHEGHRSKTSAVEVTLDLRLLWSIVERAEPVEGAAKTLGADLPQVKRGRASAP